MPTPLDIPATEAAIVETTNAFRKEHGLALLKPNAQLAAAARAYARSLASSGSLTHTANGTTPGSRARGAGYAPCQIAENLAAIYDSGGFTPSSYAKRAVTGWENSPGHRANMLLPGLTDTGIGVARAGNDPRYVAVQLLGRPEAMRYEFTVANDTAAQQSYTFAGSAETIRPHERIRHRACVPGAVVFDLGKGAANARFEVRDGALFTLEADASGGVRVKTGKSGAVP
jgi:hypothetical protein